MLSYWAMEGEEIEPRANRVGSEPKNFTRIGDLVDTCETTSACVVCRRHYWHENEGTEQKYYD